MNQPTTSYFLVSADGFVLVDATGAPASVPAELVSVTGALPESVHTSLGGLEHQVRALRCSREELDALAHQLGLRVQDARIFGSHPEVARAVALLYHRERFRHDPADGSLLTYDEDGVVATGEATRYVFPRIDPAVIGMVRLAGTEQILLGKNRRSDYYSLIAGYVDPGESLEQAFGREVREETGRRIQDIRYWGSQPWAISGSIMVAFTAVTEDEEAIWATDQELVDIVWATRAQARRLPLARPGSIAHAMVSEWMGEEEP